MTSHIVAFALASLNPVGGLFVSIPLAVLKFGWPWWVAVVCGVPLAYAQVAAVDLFWQSLLLWKRWVRFVEKRKSPKLSALLDRKDAGVWLAIVGVWLGPWLVMAVARYGGHRQSRVAVPLLFGLTYVASGLAAICAYAPGWLAHAR